MKKRNSFIVVLFSLLAALNTYAADYYIKGTFNNWGDAQKLEKNTASSDNEYMITLSCSSGNTWDAVLFYETNNNGTDYYYKSNSSNDKLALNSDYYTGENGNIYTTGFDNSKSYTFYLNVTSKKVYVTEAAAAVYLSGEMSNWVTSGDSEWKFTTTDNDTYTLTGKTIYANKNFKIYDTKSGSWLSTCNQGIVLPYNNQNLQDGSGTDDNKNMRLSADGENLTITYVRSAGDKGTITIQSVGGGDTSGDALPSNYYVWGNFIQNTGAQWARADFLVEQDSDGNNIYVTQVFKATNDGEMEWTVKAISNNNEYRNGGTTPMDTWNQNVLKSESNNNKFSGLVKDNYYRIEARKNGSNLDMRIVEVSTTGAWDLTTEPRLVLSVINSDDATKMYEYDFTWNRIYGCYCAYIPAKCSNIHGFIKGMEGNNYISKYGPTGPGNNLIGISKFDDNTIVYCNDCLQPNGDPIAFTNMELGKYYRVELHLYDGGSKARIRYFNEFDNNAYGWNPSTQSIVLHWQYRNVNTDGSDGHSNGENWTDTQLKYDPERGMYTAKIMTAGDASETPSDKYYVKYSTDNWTCREMTYRSGKYYYTISNPADAELAMNKNTKNDSDDMWAGDTDLNYDGTTRTFTMTATSSRNIKFASGLTGDYTLVYDPSDNTLTISEGSMGAGPLSLDYIRYTLTADGNNKYTFKRITSVPVNVWNAGCIWADDKGDAAADNPDFTFEPLDHTNEYGYEVQLRYDDKTGQADIRIVSLEPEEAEPTKYYIVGQHINDWNYVEPAVMTEEVEGEVYSYYTWLWKNGTTVDEEGNAVEKTGFRISTAKGSEKEFNDYYHGPVQEADFVAQNGVSYTFNVSGNDNNSGTWVVEPETDKAYYRIELNVPKSTITVTTVGSTITASVEIKKVTDEIDYSEAVDFITTEKPAGAENAPVHYELVNQAVGTITIDEPEKDGITPSVLSLYVNGLPIDNPTFGEHTYNYLPAPNNRGEYVVEARIKLATSDGTYTIENRATTVEKAFTAAAPTVSEKSVKAFGPSHSEEGHYDVMLDVSLGEYDTYNWCVGYEIALTGAQCNDGACIVAHSAYSWAGAALEDYELYDGSTDYEHKHNWSYLAVTNEHLPVVVPGYSTACPGDGVETATGYEGTITACYPFLHINGKGGVLNAETTNAVRRLPALGGDAAYAVSLYKASAPLSGTFDSSMSVLTGVNDIVADEAGEAVYYNLQGVRVANPKAGLYIRVQGRNAEKVYIK